MRVCVRVCVRSYVRACVFACAHVRSCAPARTSTILIVYTQNNIRRLFVVDCANTIMKYDSYVYKPAEWLTVKCKPSLLDFCLNIFVLEENS